MAATPLPTPASTRPPSTASILHPRHPTLLHLPPVRELLRLLEDLEVIMVSMASRGTTEATRLSPALSTALLLLELLNVPARDGDLQLES